jgi:hypothetical protein
MNVMAMLRQLGLLNELEVKKHFSATTLHNTALAIPINGHREPQLSPYIFVIHVKSKGSCAQFGVEHDGFVVAVGVIKMNGAAYTMFVLYDVENDSTILSMRLPVGWSPSP